MVIAKLETRRFSFTAYGDSEEESRKLLRQAWARHCHQFPEARSWEELELEEDVYCFFVRVGDVHRDNDLIFSLDKPQNNN
jgi:hypothetical protein